MRSSTHTRLAARPGTALGRWWLALILTVLATGPAGATVVQEFSFDELVAQSSFIFVGKVVSSREAVQGEQVVTLVTFGVDDTLKGKVASPTIELSFFGGSANGFTLKVEGQFIPPVGARGVFFVGSVDAKQVNPLTGWQQGYFPLMKNDAGVDYLDMRQRRDLAIPGLTVDPLVTKMLGMGFSSEAIDAKVPRAYLFSFADFRAAILDQSSHTQAAAP